MQDGKARSRTAPSPGGFRRTAVILVDFNGAAETTACVAHLGPPPAGSVVILVDNGSTPRLPDLSTPGVEVMRSEENLGFGGGCNLGLARALASGVDQVLFLNNDARIRWAEIDALGKALDEDVGLGCVGPVVVFPDGRFQSAGGRFGKRTLWSFDALEESTADVEYLHGCCLLLPADLLRGIGGFDGAFFMYAEDKDLCLRVLAAGRRVAVVRDVRMVHGKGLAVASDNSARLFHVTRSNLLLRRKWSRRAPRILSIPHFLAKSYYLRILKWRKRKPDAGAFWAGARAGLRDPLDQPSAHRWPPRRDR